MSTGRAGGASSSRPFVSLLGCPSLRRSCSSRRSRRPAMRPRLVLCVIAVAFLAGCAGPTGSSLGSSSAPPSSPSSSPGASPAVAGPSPLLGATQPPASPSDYKVTFGFAVPSGVVSVAHPFTPPPLRSLVGLFVGDHPEGAPAYQRMSFYFRGGYPSYKVSYVPRVVADGSGAVIPLPGNAFLQVVFTDTQSSVTSSPSATIGY